MITRTLDRIRNSDYVRPSPDQQEGRYIKSTIYGGLDGIITTFAVVAGVAGASLSSGIVLILGLANLLADGLSMAIGDYLSTQAELEYAESNKEKERESIRIKPDSVQEEIERHYLDKGIGRDDARLLSNTLARYDDVWLDTVMLEKYGVVEERESPIMNAIVTFVSFCIFGFMPLVAYVIAVFIPVISAHSFMIACSLTGLTLFLLGIQKVRFTKTFWLKAGLEMTLIGGVAALVAYGIGVLLSGIA